MITYESIARVSRDSRDVSSDDAREIFVEAMHSRRSRTEQRATASDADVAVSIARLQQLADFARASRVINKKHVRMRHTARTRTFTISEFETSASRRERRTTRDVFALRDAHVSRDLSHATQSVPAVDVSAETMRDAQTRDLESLKIANARKREASKRAASKQDR